MKDGRIYIMDAYKLNGPDGVIGLTYVAKALHPEIDLDPGAVQDFKKVGLEFPDTSISIYPEVMLNNRRSSIIGSIAISREESIPDPVSSRGPPEGVKIALWHQSIFFWC